MLSDKSVKRLAGVNQDLVRVARRAHEIAESKGLDFEIIEGVRTTERQKALVAAGKSRTMRSRHLTGDAFDFVPMIDGAPCWQWPTFWPIVEVIEMAAAELAVKVELGARWHEFPDGPHVQIPWGAK
jgi:peptidoglycan L-alanyl-D-glutamate endopeptidase CwlK